METREHPWSFDRVSKHFSLDIRMKLKLLIYNARKHLEELNLFPSTPPTTENQKLRIQLISTRVFIILLILSLYVFIIYTFTSLTIKTVIVRTPDLEKYSKLYEKYSEALTCPCTKVSITYESFLQITFSVHELCTSIFISDQWFHYINGNTWWQLYPNYWRGDFRVVGAHIFNALRSFCNLIASSISDNLSQFYSNNYISAAVIPRDVLELQSEKLVDDFTSSTTNGFVLSLRMMRETTQVNALQSAELSNYHHRYQLSTNSTVTGAVSYTGGCSCANNSTCKRELPVWRTYHSDSPWLVPNFYIGCFTVEALFQSTLFCFYNQDCLDTLQLYVESESPANASALDPNKSTRFHVNSTIGEILDQLMVEEWIYNFSYEKYYAVCQPEECSYTISSRNSVIYIITTLIGLFGGLIKALRITVPRLVSLTIKGFRREKTAATLTGT